MLIFYGAFPYLVLRLYIFVFSFILRTVRTTYNALYMLHERMRHAISSIGSSFTFNGCSTTTSASKGRYTLRDRLSDAKERAVRRVSSWLVFWSGTTKEDQLKRLDYYLRLVESARSGKYLKKWKLYTKRWYVWIIDGSMPIKILTVVSLIGSSMSM